MHLKGANSMAVSGFSYRKALVGTGWAVSLLLHVCMVGLRKQSSCLVGPPFPALSIFRSMDGWLLTESADY